MILLTRLNGEQFAVNVDLIERVETTPDTHIRMVDGAKFVVTESMEEVIAKVTEFKAAVLQAAASSDAFAAFDLGEPPETREAGRASGRTRSARPGATGRAGDRTGTDHLSVVPDQSAIAESGIVPSPEPKAGKDG